MWDQIPCFQKCEMMLCVRSMSYHDQSDPPLVARGSHSSGTKPWYLVLRACYFIKTNLQVLISTGFVAGGSTFGSLSVFKLKLSLFNWILSPSKLKRAAPKVKRKRPGRMLTERIRFTDVK